MFLRGRTMFAPTTQSQSPVNSQKKKSDVLFAFSFAIAAAKEKAIKKRRKKDYALCGARQGRLAIDPAAFPKRRAKTLLREEKVKYNKNQREAVRLPFLCVLTFLSFLFRFCGADGGSKLCLFGDYEVHAEFR